MEASQETYTQSGRGLRAKKKRRDSLISLVQTESAKQAGWAIGYEDECWFSRLAQPSLAAWSQDKESPLLYEKTLPKKDKSAKAISCYGIYLPDRPAPDRPAPDRPAPDRPAPDRPAPDRPAEETSQMLVRFCQGRPVSALTTAFFAWACPLLWARGIRVLVLFWDNASWHISKEVRSWLRQWNRVAKASGEKTRLLVHRLPSKSPWLNSIEPKWVHAKRAVSEPLQILSGQDLAERVCRHYHCENQEWLKEPSKKL